MLRFVEIHLISSFCEKVLIIDWTNLLRKKKLHRWNLSLCTNLARYLAATCRQDAMHPGLICLKLEAG